MCPRPHGNLTPNNGKNNESSMQIMQKASSGKDGNSSGTCQMEKSSSNRFRYPEGSGPKGTREDSYHEACPTFFSVEEFPKHGVIVVKKLVWKSGHLQRYLSILESG